MNDDARLESLIESFTTIYGLLVGIQIVMVKTIGATVESCYHYPEVRGCRNADIKCFGQTAELFPAVHTSICIGHPILAQSHLSTHRWAAGFCSIWTGAMPRSGVQR